MCKHSILAAALALIAAAPVPGQAAAAKIFLLNVTNGNLPADIDKSRCEIVNDFKELGGGKALKVEFAEKDSIGAKAGGNSNWKRQVLFRFDAFNPGKRIVNLELNVVHARSTNFRTRVVVPINLNPGLNQVKIGIDEMKNQNGTTADLANVERWYIHDLVGAAPTIYFSDIWLEGGEAVAPAPTAPAAAPPSPTVSTAPIGNGQPLVGYHIKGKVGAIDVDLTATPFAVAAAGALLATAADPPAHGDPGRMARIRNAKMPKITQPVMFDTPEADAILSALEVFPENNPWNLDVSKWPLHPNSKAIIESIGAAKPLRYNPDMSFILVPPDQKKVNVKIVAFTGESDPGPYPLPDVAPIEGWPLFYTNGKATLDDVQRDKLNENGDRHGIVVDPTNRMLYEFYQLKKTNAGWQAAQASIFDLKSNKMRPEEWTSADAAGLPIFPSVVRYDELKRGIVEHALRLTVVKTRRAYVYPARHFASPRREDNLPRMGERIRLRQDFDVSTFSPELQAILKGLKKYGMLVADNGIDWAISVTPDPRIPSLNDELRKITGSAFEVVEAPRGYVPPE